MPLTKSLKLGNPLHIQESTGAKGAEKRRHRFSDTHSPPMAIISTHQCKVPSAGNSRYGANAAMSLKLKAIAVLIALGVLAFVLPYDYAARCANVTALDLSYCFFRNTSVTVIRIVPLALALLIAFTRSKTR